MLSWAGRRNDFSRAISDYRKSGPIVGFGIRTELGQDFQLGFLKGVCQTLVGAHVPIEVRHQSRCGTVIRIPKARDNAFCSRNQKTARKIHDALFALKPAHAGIARRKSHEVR